MLTWLLRDVFCRTQWQVLYQCMTFLLDNQNIPLDLVFHDNANFFILPQSLQSCYSTVVCMCALVERYQHYREQADM